MSNGMPYVKWHGRDWLGDPLLRMVGPAERGVWIDLLCAMMNSEPYGHLAVKGRSMTDEEAARITGLSVDTYKGYLYRLEEAGIPSRTETGMLFSRRLVRDHEKYLVGQKSGRKGGGNPALQSEEEPEARSQKPEAIRAYSGNGIKAPYKGCNDRCTEDHAHEWTLKQVLEVASRPSVAVREEYARSFFDHYAAVGWIDGNKRRILSIAPKLRKWAIEQPSHGKTAAGSHKPDFTGCVTAADFDAAKRKAAQ